MKNFFLENFKKKHHERKENLKRNASATTTTTTVRVKSTASTTTTTTVEFGLNKERFDMNQENCHFSKMKKNRSPSFIPFTKKEDNCTTDYDEDFQQYLMKEKDIDMSPDYMNCNQLVYSSLVQPCGDQKRTSGCVCLENNKECECYKYVENLKTKNKPNKIPEIKLGRKCACESSIATVQKIPIKNDEGDRKCPPKRTCKHMQEIKKKCPCGGSKIKKPSDEKKKRNLCEFCRLAEEIPKIPSSMSTFNSLEMDKFSKCLKGDFGCPTTEKESPICCNNRKTIEIRLKYPKQKKPSVCSTCTNTIRQTCNNKDVDNFDRGYCDFLDNLREILSITISRPKQQTNSDFSLLLDSIVKKQTKKCPSCRKIDSENDVKCSSSYLKCTLRPCDGNDLKVIYAKKECCSFKDDDEDEDEEDIVCDCNLEETEDKEVQSCFPNNCSNLKSSCYVTTIQTIVDYGTKDHDDGTKFYESFVLNQSDQHILAEAFDSFINQKGCY